MAWELQTQAHERIAPSIHYASLEENEPLQWLCERWADQRWDEETGQAGYYKLVDDAKGRHADQLVQDIADFAIEGATTTNGGYEVYLDGWTSVAFCTDDQLQAWWG